MFSAKLKKKKKLVWLYYALIPFQQVEKAPTFFLWCQKYSATRNAYTVVRLRVTICLFHKIFAFATLYVLTAYYANAQWDGKCE